MRAEVTQKNLPLLIPGKVMCILKILNEQQNINLVDGIKLIYQSDMYRKLEQLDSGYWRLGPVALYEYLKEE